MFADQVEAQRARNESLQARLERREQQLEQLTEKVDRIERLLEETEAASSDHSRALEALAEQANSSVLGALPERARTTAQKVSRRLRR
ncbi:hypothetical protein [Nesterenkonia pannonica]|uniref:hypothetical protein n=1 Tax=Nesterenkonia pannonica TaxID=1548602 RepID=UPI0021643165|nr:hypothetical protein [Nesterenkonia pannonica]